MLFLSEKEATGWADLARQAQEGKLLSGKAEGMGIRTALWPHFYFYIGTLLATRNRLAESRPWFAMGARQETVALNSYLLDYIDRRGDLLTRSEPVFADSRPYIHFTTIPEIREAHANLIDRSHSSLPAFDHPIRFMDLGCGNGGLTRDLLHALVDTGQAPAIEEIFLVDPSANMLEVACRTLSGAFPGVRIVALNGRAEAVAGQFPTGFDLALSALAWHHMPFDTKRQVAQRLAVCVDHVLLFEIEGNHDTPELHSPELALSLYQVYGSMLNMIKRHPAPHDVVEACLDLFLMGELISLLSQPRGLRADYHMLRRQWHQLLVEGLGSGFECRADFTCWFDGLTELYLLHYGRR